MHKDEKRQDDRESLLSKGGKRKEEKRRTRQDSEDLRSRSQRRVGIGFSFLFVLLVSLEIIRFLLWRFCDVFLLSTSRFCDEVGVKDGSRKVGRLEDGREVTRYE